MTRRKVAPQLELAVGDVLLDESATKTVIGFSLAGNPVVEYLVPGIFDNYTSPDWKEITDTSKLRKL